MKHIVYVMCERSNSSVHRILQMERLNKINIYLFSDIKILFKFLILEKIIKYYY